MNFLFICSRNEWRSRTAETIFRNQAGISVRSAGTSGRARITVQESDIYWADHIFVMEPDHKKRLQEAFGRLPEETEVTILFIEDNYPYMDPDLIEMLKDSIEPYLP